MEGTRHERAALVGVAYFLGFLTTFIWFGLETGSVTPADVYTAAQPAAVVSALSTPQDESVSERSVVSYKKGILEATVLGETRVLSFNPETSGIEASDEFISQGMHVGTLAYTTSSSGEYVFFCEQKEATAETCLPFVYDTLSHKIYPLRKDGDRVELLLGAASEALWQGNQLSVGGELSPDTKQPWLLGQQ